MRQILSIWICSSCVSIALAFSVAPCGLDNRRYDTPPASTTVGDGKGWLIIDGGGVVTNEVKDRFVALAGGPNANFVMIPTALQEKEIDLDRLTAFYSKQFGVSHVAVLHTRDRARANSRGFVEPLRHASGVWIDGGRQWRLADAYLDTDVEHEIKELLARGGVVCGSSAGATIQGSFLVRGAPGTDKNPDGDNRIMMSPGHEVGFGLLANSAIDQHVDARGRENDLDSVISAHPELLGIGLDQAAAIVVHGDSFFVVGGQVAIHDGKQHDGTGHYFLSSGDAFDLTTRSLIHSPEVETRYPLTLTITTAFRTVEKGAVKTDGSGILESRDGPDHHQVQIKMQCNVGLYSVGRNVLSARMDGQHRLKIRARPVDTDQIEEFACSY